MQELPMFPLYVVHLRQKLYTEAWQVGQGGSQQGQYINAFDHEGFTGYHFETEQKLPFLEMFRRGSRS